MKQEKEKEKAKALEARKVLQSEEDGFDSKRPLVKVEEVNLVEK